MDEDAGEVEIFFLHFLVVATALLCFSATDEYFHGFEDSVGSAHLVVNKVLVVNLEEPMVEFVFLGKPVPVVLGLHFFFSSMLFLIFFPDFSDLIGGKNDVFLRFFWWG